MVYYTSRRKPLIGSTRGASTHRVDDDDRVFGDKLPPVREVLHAEVGSAEPERIMHPLNFLQDKGSIMSAQLRESWIAEGGGGEHTLMIA